MSNIYSRLKLKDKGLFRRSSNQESAALVKERHIMNEKGTMRGGHKEDPKGNFEKTRVLEAKKLLVCYNCNEPGHIVPSCREGNIVFSYVSDNDEDMKLLAPYVKNLIVNGKKCRVRVLRDSLPTMNMVHCRIFLLYSLWAPASGSDR